MRIALLLLMLGHTAVAGAAGSSPSGGWHQRTKFGIHIEEKSWPLSDKVRVTASRRSSSFGGSATWRTTTSAGAETEVRRENGTVTRKQVFFDPRAARASRKGTRFTLAVPPGAHRSLEYSAPIELSASDRAELITQDRFQHADGYPGHYSRATALFGLYEAHRVGGSAPAMMIEKPISARTVATKVDAIGEIEEPMVAALGRGLERLAALKDPLVVVKTASGFGAAGSAYTLTPKGLRVAHALYMRAYEPDVDAGERFGIGLHAHRTLDELLQP